MSDEPPTPLGAWLAQRPAEEASLRQTVLCELDRLFGTHLGARRWPQERLSDFYWEVGSALQGAAAGDGLLLHALAPDPARGVASIVEALAEILFLPRGERTEYVTHRLPSPPWDIRRLLLEYAFWSLQVDEVLGSLTKGFCADHCDRLPVGCCSVLGYDLGVVPEAMLRLQQLEARAEGWAPPAVEDKCKYHGPQGCCLRLFKSPACAGMLCDALVDDLGRRHATGPLGAFLGALARYRNHDLDRAEIFAAMGEVVSAGRRLGASAGGAGAPGAAERAHLFT